MTGRSYTSSADQRYKFISKERDESTGLNYFGARNYDSWIARWVQVDPSQYKHPDLIPFTYCLDNPLNNIDPDGKDPDPTGVSELTVGGAIATGILITATYLVTINYLEHPSYSNFPNQSNITNTGFALGVALYNKVANWFSTGNKEQSPESTQENTNPYAGPVTKPVTVIDQNGNAIPVKAGEQIKTFSDGKWVDIKKADGKTSTKNRIDNCHPEHSDPRAQKPHAHRTGVTSQDRTPWLPIK